MLLSGGWGYFCCMSLLKLNFSWIKKMLALSRQSATNIACHARVLVLWWIMIQLSASLPPLLHLIPMYLSVWLCLQQLSYHQYHISFSSIFLWASIFLYLELYTTMIMSYPQVPFTMSQAADDVQDGTSGESGSVESGWLPVYSFHMGVIAAPNEPQNCPRNVLQWEDCWWQCRWIPVPRLYKIYIISKLILIDDSYVSDPTPLSISLFCKWSVWLVGRMPRLFVLRYSLYWNRPPISWRVTHY